MKEHSIRQQHLCALFHLYEVLLSDGCSPDSGDRRSSIESTSPNFRASSAGRKIRYAEEMQSRSLTGEEVVALKCAPYDSGQTVEEKILRRLTESLNPGLGWLVRKSTVLLIYPRQRVTNSENLFCVDGDVASLTGCTTRWLYRVTLDDESARDLEHARCIIIVEFGRACLWPFSPRRSVRASVAGCSVPHTSGQ
jgi:hypothetical protein